MTPRAQAEQIADKLIRVAEGPMPRAFRIVEIADQLNALLLAARRDALLEAANSVKMLGQIYGERLLVSGVAEWLRARAAEQKGNSDA